MASLSSLKISLVLLYFLGALCCVSGTCMSKHFPGADLREHNVDPDLVNGWGESTTCFLESNETSPVAICEVNAVLPSQTKKTCGLVESTHLGNGIMISVYAPGDRTCGDGIFLPIFPGEELWSHGTRAFLYFIALMYSFLGIAIAADKFMIAIEVITSREKTITVTNAQGKREQISVRVWNETIANLTLMALGSSAPEILLAIVETVSQLGKPPAPGLGASTIVGSAAFNLLAISAICVSAIPDGESRRIHVIGVFNITAAFSVLAYVWLVVVLTVITPNVVDLWEALVTLAFFPLLTLLSYAQDRRWGKKQVQPTPGGGGGGDAHLITGVRGSNDGLFHPDADREKKQLMSILKNKTDVSPADLLRVDAADLADLAAREIYDAQQHSALHYRINATRAIGGGQRVMLQPDGKERAMQRVLQKSSAADATAAAGGAESKAGGGKAGGGGASAGTGGSAAAMECFVNFASHQYAVYENEEKIEIVVQRSGRTDEEASVDFETSNAAAQAGTDYVYTSGRLLFPPGELTQRIVVPIIDDNEYEPDEDFYVTLRHPSANLRLGATPTTRVLIINDDNPGTFQFSADNYVVKESEGQVELTVTRVNGTDGCVKVGYKSADGSATAGEDYVAVEGTLVFAHGEMDKKLVVPIVDDQRYELDETFTVELTIHNFPDCGALYGRVQTATVTITNDEELAMVVDNVAALLRQNMSRVRVGSSSWLEQMQAAISVSGEDGEEPAGMDYVMHFLTFGWKVIFSIIPPTDYYNGWATFVVALAMIGLLTAFVGDIAAIFGCTLGLTPAITAITFVALGTSLPDTFASKSAAVNSPHADASVGNVTGSNSVNVFLGLGLPWTLAAIYHAVVPGAGPYVVAAGSISFSVVVFCACALICIAVLYIRRLPSVAGAELGGPRALKFATSALFFLLWLIYILLSSLESLGAINGF